MQQADVSALVPLPAIIAASLNLANSIPVPKLLSIPPVKIQSWDATAGWDSVPSPALLIDVAAVEANLRAAVDIAGDPTRLRLHVKTVKMAEPLQMAQRLGVSKWKCATLAEAALVAENGGKDILLAYPTIGPNMNRLRTLGAEFPDVRFSTLVDNMETANALAETWETHPEPLSVWIDIETGMGRTGILPEGEALELAHRIDALPSLALAGLSHYDGHIRDVDPEERKRNADASFERTSGFRDRLRDAGIDVPAIVAGGSPTFAIHAQHPDVQLSPGTIFLWDFGYGDAFPDLPFQPAAALLSRVISRPSKDTLCLDLGHKAVAAENPHPRVRLIGLEDAVAVSQSEEHLVVQTDRASKFPVGTPVLGIPKHVCPTVALYQRVVAKHEDGAMRRWEVVARDRDYRLPKRLS